MGKGAVLSGVLHVTVILILVVGLPSFVSMPEVALPIPVELASLDEDLPKPKPEPEKKPEPEPELPKEEAKLPPPPAPPVKPLHQPEPAPEPEEVTLPPEPVDEPLPEPPEPEALPDPEEVAAPLPPKPLRKPRLKIAQPEKPKEPEEPEDRLTSILRNVDKLKKQQAAAPEPNSEQSRAASAPQASRIEQMELVRAIRQQIAACWRLEPGARNAEDLVVEIRIALNRDGSVRGQPQIIDHSRMTTDAFYRSAAENARRAILSCQPFELPLRRYEVWRDMTLRFDPRQMFGG